MSEKKGPIEVKEKPGVVHYCMCGKSTTLPYCDGKSHEGTGFTPYEYKVEQEEVVRLCTCGQSSNKPFCDGTHMLCP
ncbi:Iron sulfur domain-containing, CDGSH-type [Spirochaeta thermophila DSM 6578]|uniref:Iron sulfur domain-containing, CDGSH-type n=1 Tax=Winmispira thermophila (strain ATCC 700085 / DSM 6578 / Z-1203) TaxID=869211 RepID=G0GDQ3_WINT7|nr:CDGSH iron-sulfur domain-containing protein [Spirochaeta thermophila]AEJ62183.1 Iron sulfur domain-containing, CDGSH-type [Spirochaeta thermophila DSM 6578]